MDELKTVYDFHGCEVGIWCNPIITDKGRKLLETYDYDMFSGNRFVCGVYDTQMNKTCEKYTAIDNFVWMGKTPYEYFEKMNK